MAGLCPQPLQVKPFGSGRVAPLLQLRCLIEQLGQVKHASAADHAPSTIFSTPKLRVRTMAELVSLAGAAGTGLVASDLALIGRALRLEISDREQPQVEYHRSPGRGTKSYRTFVVQEARENKKALAELAEACVERNMLT